MSQHYYDFNYKGRKAKVTLGYDQRLEEFFMSVSYIDPPIDPTDASSPNGTADASKNDTSADDYLVYSDRQEEQDVNRSLDHFQRKLESLQIRVPDSLFDEVFRDAMTGTQNRIAYHFDDGRVEEVAMPHADASVEISRWIVSTQHEPAELLPFGPSGYLPAGYVRFDFSDSGEMTMELLDCTFDWMGRANTHSLLDAPFPGPFGVWLQDWSDYKNLPQALVNAGIVRLTGEVTPFGKFTAPHGELTPLARDMYVRSRLDFYNRKILLQAIVEKTRENKLTAAQQDYLKIGLSGRTCTKLLREGLTIAEIIERHLAMKK